MYMCLKAQRKETSNVMTFFNTKHITFSKKVTGKKNRNTSQHNTNITRKGEKVSVPRAKPFRRPPRSERW